MHVAAFHPKNCWHHRLPNVCSCGALPHALDVQDFHSPHWILWDGEGPEPQFDKPGDPDSGGPYIDVKRASGLIEYGKPVDHVDWARFGDDYDVVAYRLRPQWAGAFTGTRKGGDPLAADGV